MPGLVGERNALCSRVTVLERELLRLRDHFTLIRDRHRKLANELITHSCSLSTNSIARPLKHPVDRQNGLASRRAAVVRHLNR